ncbi:flagellar hook-length control protein FliK [Robertmurraya kyonggiensis]|uniref:Flagellar hook-length control protein-like C-terminal domain-containing protein n=1 Tax=Robertmurraya kyonggiensis TaxID=1037680 RepID=A0A4V6WND9_9BACI|nr:flagellar hook-length control protein FliK [Robertmurraya kyonggiensis]TKC18660.1 hypothetical protein FA727_03650 [Robertmurraya kyonggiensis]
MQIGGLGFINTIASPVKESTQTSGENGFQGLFGLMLTGTQTSEASNLETSSGEMTKEQLLDLLGFLKSEDIFEVEGGMNLLNQSMSATDQKELLSFIQEALGSDVDLGDFIQNLKDTLGLIVTQPSSEDVETEPNIEDILAVLTQMASVPLEDLKKAFNGDTAQLVKAIKLVDLLASENGTIFEKGITDKGTSFDQSKMKDLLQQLTTKLEQFVETGAKSSIADPTKQAAKMEYLQKAFAPVAAEINAKLSTTNGISEIQSEQKPAQAKVEVVTGAVQFQQVSKAEQLTLTLSQSGKPTSTADLIKQFENVLAKSQFSNGAGTQKLLIRLNPENLGALRIELIQRDAGIVAKIMTTTQLAKETLESHLNGLKQAFGSQNIQVDRLEVTQSVLPQQDRYFGREQQQQSQQQGQERQEQQNGNEDVKEQNFNISLEEALINTEV